MALILNAIWGSFSANSYCTVAESNSYHESRYHTSDWLDGSLTTTSMKNASLVWATSLIDQLFKWDGTKVNQVQALACPRYGVCDIEGWLVDMTYKPTWIANATAEYAYWLLKEDLLNTANADVINTGAADLSGFKEITVGPITLKSSIGESSSSSSSNSSTRIMPLSVYSIIKPYGSLYTNQQRRLVR